MHVKSKIVVFNFTFHSKNNINPTIYERSPITSFEQTSKFYTKQSLYKHGTRNAIVRNNFTSKYSTFENQISTKKEQLMKTSLFNFHVHWKLYRVKQWCNSIHSVIFNCIIRTQ
ncbi:hypothetical protein I4U23_008907 [Adineta vaga]|nr:hypothetical protein I4U23_008907 [Adineta vaga]